MSYDVSVPRSLPPKFPDRCVICGTESPGRQARFHAGANYGAFFFLSWFSRGQKSVLAPACGSCAVSALSRGLLRFAVSAAAAALAAWFLFWFVGMKGGGRGMFKLKAVAVFFAAVIPAVVWDWLFPAKFSVTFDDESHTATCHFSSAPYAAEFDALNHPPIPDSLELPEDLQLGGGQPSPRQLELPANFNPTAASGSSHPSASSYMPAESYEDKTNPFRNLEDPRFKK
jgi:hypothetical protein